ncbi:MAG: transposase [Kiritimatiellia bacterium]
MNTRTSPAWTGRKTTTTWWWSTPKREIPLCATFPHTREGWKQLREALGACPGSPWPSKPTRGSSLTNSWRRPTWPSTPSTPRRPNAIGNAKPPPGVKDDQFDAWSMADALRVDGHGWRQLTQHDALTEELQVITRDELVLIEQRTQLANQLRVGLARLLIPPRWRRLMTWTLESSWAFVATFSTPQALVAAGKHKWEKFLHTHKLRRPQTMERRLRRIFAAADHGRPRQRHPAPRSCWRSAW